MQGFIAGVAVSFILFIVYYKTYIVPKLNKRIKTAYRKGWDACRVDLVKILSASNCKESDEKCTKL